MNRASFLVAIAALAVVVGAVLATPANYPPCPSEDSTWCVWNGAEQGNRQGATVINLWEGTYITP